jgi:hypothetical protein
MERRGFLKAFTTAVGGLGVSHRTVELSPVYWGPMDPTRHRLLCHQGVHLHVFVGREDVSRRCRFFDDTPGREVAELYRVDATGRKHLTDHGEYGEGRLPMVAVETVKVFEVREGAPFE